jgi:hypothetical protein
MGEEHRTSVVILDRGFWRVLPARELEKTLERPIYV